MHETRGEVDSATEKCQQIGNKVIESRGKQRRVERTAKSLESVQTLRPSDPGWNQKV